MLIPKRLLLVTGITLTQFACSRELPPDSPPPPNVTEISITAEVPATPAQPPTTLKRTTTTVTEGGSEKVRDIATGTGGRMEGSGDAAKLDNGVFTVPAATLEAIGNAIGGGVSGSLTAKIGGTGMIRLLAFLACVGLGLLAYLNFKKNPLDWHYTGGLALGSLAAFAVLIEPELLYWGIAGVVIAALVNFWPSISAAKFRSAGDEFQEFIDADKDRAEAWADWKRTHGEDKDKPIFKILRKDAI